jgi:cell division protein ZapE
MQPNMATQARRFTWLIDIMYDHKVNLIMSAEVSPENLYTQGQLSEEFHRTVSRIIEMQSKEYLEHRHKLHVNVNHKSSIINRQ